jgi:hypothetical protein
MTLMYLWAEVVLVVFGKKDGTKAWERLQISKLNILIDRLL